MVFLLRKRKRQEWGYSSVTEHSFSKPVGPVVLIHNTTKEDGMEVEKERRQWAVDSVPPGSVQPKD